MKNILIATVCALAPVVLLGQSASHSLPQLSTGPVSLGNGPELRPVTVAPEPFAPVTTSNHQRVGVASDWAQHHVLFPASKNLAVMTRLQADPRYTQSWFLRHREVWWPGRRQELLRSFAKIERDWNVPLGFPQSTNSISSVTQSGTTVTVTTTSANTLANGQLVVISGVETADPPTTCAVPLAAAIDGDQTITVTSSTTFTFTSSQSGTVTGGSGSACTLTGAIVLSPAPFFQPLVDFAFDATQVGSPYGYTANEAGNGTINTMDQLNGVYLATVGTLVVTASNDQFGADNGTYSLYPGGPSLEFTPDYVESLDDKLAAYNPSANAIVDASGMAFAGSGRYVGLVINHGGISYWNDSGFNYEVDSGNPNAAFANLDPGGGQTFPAKYVFDVTAPLTASSCSTDYAAIGIQANAVAGTNGQANIVGYNNLYSGPGGLCTSGPSVMFAYASGTGEVPGSISLSQDGTQLAYIEDDLPTSSNTSGSSVFHVLTIGTNAGNEGTSPTDPATPGANGSGAVDTTVPLVGGTGSCATQSSTTSPFVRYTTNDAYPDAAYVTTYSWSTTVPGTGTGCLYKISPVFSGGTPVIAWSIPISAVPSSPVWDSISNNVFFTDSNGDIDFVTDSGTPAGYSSVAIASGSTSENPPTIDGTNEMVYATFNKFAGNAIVAQYSISGGTVVAVPVGTGSTTYSGPYGVDFNNAWYTGTGTPVLYVAGTGTGTVPTLYSVGFTGTTLNASYSDSAPLTSSTDPITTNPTVADASDVTEFYNPNANGGVGVDYLFVGVTDSCIATNNGGRGGCVMSLDITNGFPTVGAGSTAIPAAGGSTGIIVDNDSDDGQASSAYYGTKDGGTLVKATQSGLD